jgi:hypothetical protein
MQHIDEDLKSFANDIVGFPTMDVDDKSDATTVVFELGVVKALFSWNSG